jgi:hypothetical protein
MSFRSGLYVFAIIGLTLSLSGQAWSQSAIGDEPMQEESATDAQQNIQEDRQPAVDLTPALNDIESAIRVLIAEEDKRATEAQESREKRDLNSQEAMAFWAKWMFFATLATVFLTFVALVYIRRTLIETKDTVRAADATVIATREIGQAQVRAYLSFEVENVKFKTPVLAPDDTSDPRPNIVVSFGGSLTNSGQSPASEVRIIFEIGEIIQGKAIEIGDGKDFHHQPPIAFSADLKALKTGDKIIFFAIILQWTDVFGKTIRSDPTFGTTQFNYDSQGNRKVFFGNLERR